MDDLGTPSPHKGSICCEKEIDRFSICDAENVGIVGRESKRNVFLSLIFGLDIGTTSIGFAVVDHDVQLSTGTVLYSDNFSLS